MVKRKAKAIPLLPLEPGVIFLPGVSHRISALARPDIVALLSHISGRGVSLPTRANHAPASPTIAIGFVPLRSPYLSRDGKMLITADAAADDSDADEARKGLGGVDDDDKISQREREARRHGDKSGGQMKEVSEVAKASEAREQNLYGYGVLAKLVGVQGGKHGDLTLLVEGISRFEVKEVMQERPYFEAKVIVFEDEGVFVTCRGLVCLFFILAEPGLTFLT